LGSPEGELPLAQALIYLACAPKSNAAYTALASAIDDVKNNGSDPVPLHLRNPSSNLGIKMGYGASYRYDHDEPSNVALGQSYFPDSHKRKVYYNPTDNGLEKQIKTRLDSIRQAIAKAQGYDK
jgi:putative ATPase